MTFEKYVKSPFKPGLIGGMRWVMNIPSGRKMKERIINFFFYVGIINSKYS